MRRIEIASRTAPGSGGTAEDGRAFEVVAVTERSEAAAMVLPPGGTTGGPHNRHRNSDQWLYVLSGSGTARVGEREARLEPGVLLLIEAGEEHALESDGREPLRTLNVYAPPEY